MHSTQLRPLFLHYLEEDIASKAIELRRTAKINLADAVIAATAILNNFELATRNINDFKMIKEIKLINPLLT
jgi:predicted nucleic acid-binding protein